MRMIGLLSFFDEPAENLTRCVIGLHRAGVEHLVAVDGRYALYDRDDHLSHPNQHAAIVLACREVGITLTLHSPSGPWEGNETEKRSFLFALGHAVSQPGDWLFVVDADEFIVNVPVDLRDRLASTNLDVAEIALMDMVAARINRPDFPVMSPVRKLFRAQQIAVGPAHWDYVTPDNRLLWGSEGTERGRDGLMEPALELLDFEIEHHPDRRPADRLHGKRDYYARRDEAGIESVACAWCGDGTMSVRMVACDWQIHPQLGAPVSQWKPACAQHAERAERLSHGRLRYLGVDPERVRVLNHNGRLVTDRRHNHVG